MGESFRRQPQEEYLDKEDGINKLERRQYPVEFISGSNKFRNKFNKILGPQIGITDKDDLFDLRRSIQEKESVPQLKDIQLTLDIVNFLRDYYGFKPISQEEYDAINATSQEVAIEESEAQEPLAENYEEGIPVSATEQEVIAEDTAIDLGENTSPDEIADETPDQIETVSQEPSPLEADQVSEPSVDIETLAEQPDSSAEEGGDAPSPEVSDDVALQDALDKAEANVQEEVKQSQSPEELSSDNEVTVEKIERLNQAREAIRVYQEFGQQHPYHTRDQATQEQYRKLEKLAWESLNKIAHSEGGDIITLPQQRDIELSHPEPIDTRQYLETMGYQFDSEGNIIMIADKGKSIVLNRSYPIDDIVNSPRPAHVVYDRDVNLDEAKTLTYYHGHLVRGLNPNTPEFIKGVLDKNFLESNIVEENPVSEAAPTLNAQELESTSEPEMSTISKEGQTSVATENGIPFDKEESIPQNEIDKLRVAYAKAEEFYNRNRRDEDAKAELERIREEYNQTLEKVFGIMVAEGVEKDIHKIFVQEVYNLREARITQSKELQSGFERKINPIKEKLLNFAIKNKKLWAGINIALAVGGGFFALSGAGLPVAGAFEATRRSIASIMAGVSVREGTRALLEDADAKLGKLKWQSVIPKLVGESLQDGYMDTATDTDLSTKLSTLEAYYRLNGGKFTNDSQQKAYETILTELGQRVQKTTIENNQPKENNDSKLMQGEENKETSPSTDSEVENKSSTPEEKNYRYTSELLKTMSEKRISELQKQQKKRLIANVVGTAVGGSLMVSLAIDISRPGGILNPEQVSEAPNASETVEPPSTPNSTESPANPIEPNIPSPSEAAPSVAETVVETAQQLTPEQLQDISELSSGETLWSEMAIKLGENATDAQIQQAVEAYMRTSEGQETMFSLASQTEVGRALLSQWGIDNATELSQVSKSDLFELSRHLGVGELKGLDTLDLSNLPPLDEISTPTGFNPAESASSGVTPPGAESVPQVDQNVFMSEIAKTLGIDKVNLTETEFTNIMYSYLETEQGRDALYNLAISDESGKLLLEQFGVNSLEDFSKLSAPEVYDIAQSVDLTNLEGFNFNDIMLSKFENAPDSISLIKGSGPLTQVNQYIDLYAGGLPYDSTLGQEVLTTYLQTPEGKDWVYDAIVNNPDTLNGNENVQWAKEYIRYRDIQQGSDIDWTTLSQDRKFPTSIFWKETVLTGGRRLPPLSTLLKPGEMPGIKKALEKVLTLKQ